MRRALAVVGALLLSPAAWEAPPTVAATALPPWGASHSCVRVPMWIAPELYATHETGTAVIVYA